MPVLVRPDTVAAGTEPRRPPRMGSTAVRKTGKGARVALGLSPPRGPHPRPHPTLCWLALLLIRVVENVTGDTWRTVRHELDWMHLVTLATGDGRVANAP
jgi:hypothetical protein